MGIGEQVVSAIKRRQERKRMTAEGPFGDFYRNGGDDLLYQLPVKTGELVIDAGGFEGEWTASMLARYGCRSEIFEPIPGFAKKIVDLFKHNDLVSVHEAALGGSDRMTKFAFADDGSSEHCNSHVGNISARVIDIASVMESHAHEDIACLKLNIEGGEYEVLERILERNQARRFKSFLIQFHRQPSDYESRLAKIRGALALTHDKLWGYDMIWELWVIRDENAI